MLRLRARYVSKAAILKAAGYDRTGPESKSSLNLKGLNRGRRIVATIFPWRFDSTKERVCGI